MGCWAFQGKTRSETIPCNDRGPQPIGLACPCLQILIVKENWLLNWPWTSFTTVRRQAEFCFENTVGKDGPHWVLSQTRWVLRETYRGNFSSYISNSKTFKSVSVSVIKSIPQKNNSKKLPGCKCNLLKFLRSDWRDKKSTLTLRSHWPATDWFRVFGLKSGENGQKMGYGLTRQMGG